MLTDLTNPKFTKEDLERMALSKYRTKKVNLVLVGGKLKTGKTTSANYIQDKLTTLYPSLSVEHTAFAKPIKEIAYSVFHWDGNKDERGRRLLQVIGTEAGREYNENIWVEYLENYILGNLFIPNVVIVDDWRFPNERDYFSKNFIFDVTTVRLVREVPQELGIETYTHPSENSLPYHGDYDYQIENNGSIEDLYKKLDSVIDYLSKKVITY
jgi:hypothetical protein